jgi:hypothetical protein
MLASTSSFGKTKSMELLQVVFWKDQIYGVITEFDEADAGRV